MVPDEVVFAEDITIPLWLFDAMEKKLLNLAGHEPVVGPREDSVWDVLKMCRHAREGEL